MIDEEKIQEAAYDMNDGDLTNDKLMRGGFVCGAQWAQKEFVNSLWHDASEEPTPKSNCLLYVRYEYEDAPEDNYWEYTTAVWLCDGWSEDHFPSEPFVAVEKWCYLSDILPQKGGEE